MRYGASAADLVAFLASQGIVAYPVRGSLLEAVPRARARLQLYSGAVYCDRDAEPVSREESICLHPLWGMGHWMSFIGLTDTAFEVIEPKGRRLRTYPIEQIVGADMQYGVETADVPRYNRPLLQMLRDLRVH
jgi:hypothetical protein